MCQNKSDFMGAQISAKSLAKLLHFENCRKHPFGTDVHQYIRMGVETSFLYNKFVFCILSLFLKSATVHYE